MQVYPHKRSSDKVSREVKINQKITSIKEKLIIATENSKLAECKLHEAEKRAEKAEKKLCFFQEEAQNIKQKIYQLDEENKSQKLKLEERVTTADMKVSKIANEVAKLTDEAEKKLINAKAAMVKVIHTRARKAEQELCNAKSKAEKDLTDAGKKIATLEEKLKEFQLRTKNAEEELGTANMKAKKLASQAEEQSIPNAPCEVKLEDESKKWSSTLREKLRKAATAIQSTRDKAVQVEISPCREDKQMILKKTLVQANRQPRDALAKLKQKNPSTQHVAATLECEIIHGEVTFVS